MLHCFGNIKTRRPMQQFFFWL